MIKEYVQSWRLSAEAVSNFSDTRIKLFQRHSLAESHAKILGALVASGAIKEQVRYVYENRATGELIRVENQYAFDVRGLTFRYIETTLSIKVEVG